MSVVALNLLLDGMVPCAAKLGECAVNGLSLDSRQVRPGDLFIALNGTQVQGRSFISAAVAAGAVAVLYEAVADGRDDLVESDVPLLAVQGLADKVGQIAERFYSEPSAKLFMVGVTGTNGKSSCSHFLAQALDVLDGRCAVLGTLGNGFIEALEEATHTTPDALTLHRLLDDLVSRGATQVVMEVSSHALDQGRVAGVHFDLVLLTNLSREHLDYHGDMVGYRQAKKRLFMMPGVRYAVINGDDPFGCELLDALPEGVEALSYSLEGKGELRGVITQLGREGMTLQIDSPWGCGELQSGLLGRFNASNLLAVLGALLLKGVPLTEALNALAELKTVPGRMERFSGQGQPLVVVDYAHTPDALGQVLVTLRDHLDGDSTLWCLFGCGGDRDRGKRPLMGAKAERYADHLVITDDNPRSESSRAIIDEICSGLQAPEQAQVIPDRGAAIAAVIRQAASSDLVLVAGRGHECWQQVGDERRPLSDRLLVRELLQVAA